MVETSRVTTPMLTEDTHRRRREHFLGKARSIQGKRGFVGEEGAAGEGRAPQGQRPLGAGRRWEPSCRVLGASTSWGTGRVGAQETFADGVQSARWLPSRVRARLFNPPRWNEAALYPVSVFRAVL